MHPKAQQFRNDNPELATWLREAAERGFRFAASLDASVNEWGGLTDKQLAAAHKCMSEDAQRKAARKPESDLTLDDLPAGYYAVPNGETRLKVRVKRPESGKWEGWVFVDDGAAYGQQRKYGSQRPGGAYRGDIVEQLRTIASDPRAASIAYGRLVGRCGVCNRVLEDEVSVARGIGPICAGRMEWDDDDYAAVREGS